MDALMDLFVRMAFPLWTLVVLAGAWCLLARMAWDAEAQELHAQQTMSHHEDRHE